MKICYGPVWFLPNGQRVPVGASTALCQLGKQGAPATMSKDKPTVTCPDCQRAMPA